MMNICRKDPGLPTDSFYEIRAGCTDVPVTKFRIKAGKTLSVRRWRSAFTPEGYLDISKCLSRIYSGGIHPSIRGEVWEFLLGCYDPKSTFDEREKIRQRRSHMFPVVGSGKFVTARVITANGDPVQDPVVLLEANLENLPTPESQESDAVDSREHDKDIIQWKLALHQIGLDVVRTDRSLTFYEKQENLAKLWDVLAVYAWYDKDVGYGQGG
ncbi:hypothetical protein M8C21_033375 [Ambrosia artemisiifolia]|uniref:Rab-GAP TBC domain-containing protein n=1 Tax=Ambrosia artemisiifolia TaxID=4212 RepID=A0AAD5BPM8_AMBAR|nr:hypothetical protein M8C21_033375 [Ambrosia artemisiifolia]